MITLISVRTTVINCCGAVLGPAARLAAFLASRSWMPVPAWAAATTMPPAIAKRPRGWTGQNGPCGESPVLPLPRKVCCAPVPREKRPRTRNRKEPSTLKEPESPKASSTSWGSPRGPQGPPPNQGAPSRPAWPPPHRRAGRNAPGSLPCPRPFHSPCGRGCQDGHSGAVAAERQTGRQAGERPASALPQTSDFRGVCCHQAANPPKQKACSKQIPPLPCKARPWPALRNLGELG